MPNQATASKARQRLSDGWHVREGWKPMGRSHRQQFELAGSNQRQRDSEVVEHQIDIPGQQPLQRRSRPAIGNVAQLDLCHQLEELGRKMRRRSVSLRSGSDPVGIVLQVFYQLAQIRGLYIVGIDDERVRHHGHHDDRFELERIECQVAIEILIDHERRRR